MRPRTPWRNFVASDFPISRPWSSRSRERQVAGPASSRGRALSALARLLVGCSGCAPRGWERGACESPFLGQAGGDCGAGGAFLAGRAAGTNVFPTWPRVPRSARSHGQDAPAATPAPAASFPQNRGGGGRRQGERNWASRGAGALARCRAHWEPLRPGLPWMLGQSQSTLSRHSGVSKKHRRRDPQ